MLGLYLSLETLAASQYIGWDFNSFVELDGDLYGVSPAGLFLIGGDDDNGTPISSIVSGPMTDFGADQVKRIRNVYMGGKAAGPLTLTLATDDKEGVDFYMDNWTSAMGLYRQRGSRDQKGRFWQWTIANVNGSDFEINTVTMRAVVLGLRPRG